MSELLDKVLKDKRLSQIAFNWQTKAKIFPADGTCRDYQGRVLDLFFSILVNTWSTFQCVLMQSQLLMIYELKPKRKIIALKAELSSQCNSEGNY